MSKFVEANEKIAEKVVEGYKKIEDGVVTGYKKMETGVVEGFTKVTDKCVEVLFTKNGETVEEAKKRLDRLVQNSGMVEDLSPGIICAPYSETDRDNLRSILT